MFGDCRDPTVLQNTIPLRKFVADLYEGFHGKLAPSVLWGVSAARLLLDPPHDRALFYAMASGLSRLSSLARGAGTGGVGGAGELVTGGSLLALRGPHGETRDVYHPLVLHLNLRAFLKHYETLPVSAWSACESTLDDAVAPMRGIEQFAGEDAPADATALVLWRALCVLDQALLTKRDVDVELVDAVVHRLLARPGHGGSLHPFDDGPDGESLDAWTYRELVGVHALANLALLRRNKTWAARVREVTRFHLENTQPDNTTSQPWGVFAFMWSPETRSFAQQQIHDATAARAMTQIGEEGSGVNPLSAMLLADAFDAMLMFG